MNCYHQPFSVGDSDNGSAQISRRRVKVDDRRNVGAGGKCDFFEVIRKSRGWCLQRMDHFLWSRSFLSGPEYQQVGPLSSSPQFHSSSHTNARDRPTAAVHSTPFRCTALSRLSQQSFFAPASGTLAFHSLSAQQFTASHLR